MSIVKFIPNNPFSLSHGGFEIQTKLTLNAVQKAGVDAQFIDYYEMNSDYDIVHLWGASQSSAKIAELAKKAKKKVVVTALLSYIETPREKIQFYLSNLLQKYKHITNFEKNCDKLVVVNEQQKKIANDYFNISKSKIEVIPNVVDSIFYTTTNNYSDGFVLCSGNICRRKNQLQLIKACILIQQPLVLLGQVLDGEQHYGKDIELLIKNHSYIKWIKGLPHSSHEMLELYQKASMIALPSYIEQQPISLLEGAALNKPLLTSNLEYGRQMFYENAMLIDPNSVESIANGIKSILKNMKAYKVPLINLEHCKLENVGKAYKSLYDSMG